jgi:tRNA(fMet)-specific endonuclease VapC
VYLFDTDTLSALMDRFPPDGLIAKRSSVPPSELATSSITLGEIVYGAHRVFARTREIVTRLEAILPSIPVLPFDAEAARRYGQLRAELDRRGTPIGGADTRIASIALARSLIVVTGNVRHFQMVPGLIVENWLS